MQVTGDNSGASNRMGAYRGRLREAGLRPVQIWVPDIRRPGLAGEAARQSLLAAGSPDEAEALAFIDMAADTGNPV